ncbi:MAG: hypothetical protein ACTSQF_05545 [Candidatus Heimdallarchaeaceae archaeon]
MKINKMYVYLFLTIIVTAGFYSGSIVLGTVHEKHIINATIGDTVQGTIKSRFGEGMNNQIIIRFFMNAGSIRYFIFTEDLWSNLAETKDGYAIDTLSAADPKNNNVTLIFNEAGSYVMWIESSSISVTMEVSIINEMIAPGLAISGLVSIALITLWLIRREQKLA